MSNSDTITDAAADVDRRALLRPAARVVVVALLVGLLVGPDPFSQETATVVSGTAVPPSPEVDRLEVDLVPTTESPLPVRLRIPSINVAAAVRPVGMTDSVTMEVPSDISVVGWFDRSVLPVSDAGHAVFVGHRDGVGDPNGVFRNLGTVEIGDAIEVRDLSGQRSRYSVADVDVLSDATFAEQASEIFRTSGPHRLILITCGGAYDASRGGYQANVVVVATRT